MEKIYIANDLGVAYKLEDGVLMFSPLVSTRVNGNYTFDTEFYEVEESLIDEERVRFQDADVTFKEVFKEVKEVLKS